VPSDEVVETVSASGRLVEQVIVEHLRQAAPRDGQIRAGESGGGVCVDVLAEMQAESAEQAALGR
jgi:hypothetical protein